MNNKGDENKSLLERLRDFLDDNGYQDIEIPSMKQLIISIAIFFIIVLGFFKVEEVISKKTTKPYSEFLQMVDKKEIKEVEITETSAGSPVKIKVIDVKDNTFKVNAVKNDELVTLLYEKDVVFSRYQVPVVTSVMISSLSLILQVIVYIAVLTYIIQKVSDITDGQSGKIGKKFEKGQNNITFNDVAGQEEAKEQLVEVVNFLKNKEKYSHIGAKLPTGILLEGPPGTGKTLISNALANEADVNFYSASASQFIELYVGMGAKRVRELFKEAKNNSPSIIFIDELDAIGGKRSGSGGSNSEAEQTLNELLVQMDGFDSSSDVIVLGATNRPEFLDNALLRPGRFDRRVILNLPNLQGRIDILKSHTSASKVRLEEDVDLHQVALMTTGASGADLANIVNEAAILAVGKNHKQVKQEDIEEAVEVVFVGKERKTYILNEFDKKLIAYHEVGHAAVAAEIHGDMPIQKITMIPRTSGALGFTMQSPKDERVLVSKSTFEKELSVLAGGRAAEDVFFDTITTGASNDIEKMTSIARDMVTTYGMSSDMGMINFAVGQSKYLGSNTTIKASEKITQSIEEEMIELVNEAYSVAKKIIIDNKDKIDEISKFLIEKENISGDEFMEMWNK